MEALTISEANLDIIEKNLGSVAKELSSVMNNINSVNTKVNKVEEKVADLNEEVKSLIKEIRETTVITNARQSIMYNNEQISKKYNYYNQVRRNIESLLDTIENSTISKKKLIALREDLLLNNPNYWLSNALTSLSSWLLNDKVNTEKELNNALRKDQQKTSLFFCLINVKLNRISTSINWLKYYLGTQNPKKLSGDFLIVLDLVSTGILGNQGKEIIITRLKDWINIIHQDQEIEQDEISKWLDFLLQKENKYIKNQYLQLYSKDEQILKNNLEITSSYQNVLSELQNITQKEQNKKNINEIIKNFIYEYEEEEQIFEKENLKNRLIIECNGDKRKAEELYQKQENIYSSKINLISLLSNIVIYKERYKLSNETQKLALSLIKNDIIKAYDILNSNINENEINISFDDFNFKTKDGENKKQIENEINLYINNKYSTDDKYLIIILIIINILGMIGICITLSNNILTIILSIVLLISDIYLLYTIISKRFLVEKSKQTNKNDLYAQLEKILAETIDYKNILENNKKDYQKLIVFLNSINIENYASTNNERKISIGE